MSVAGSPHRVATLDTVRGLALLGSAVATALLWLGGRRLGPGYRPLDGDRLDRGVDALTGVLVDNRVLPVFALLLGCSLAVRTRRRADGARWSEAVPDEAEWADGLRRAGLLLGLGAVHAALLLEADVLGTLAVVMLLAVPLVRAGAVVHVLVGLLVVPPLLVHGAADGFGGSVGFPDPPADYLLSVVDRVGTWLFGLALLPLTQTGLLVAVIAGIRLVRSGWALDPAAHRRGLLAVGLPAAAVGLLGALPYARVLAGGPFDVSVSLRAGALDSLTGPAGALGVVCLGLVVTTLVRPAAGGAGAGARAVAALGTVGRRSLVVYLVHSVVLAAVLAPWAGGAGSRWGSAEVSGLAVGLWSVTVLAALRAGRGDGPPPAPPQPSERQGRERRSAT